jgi:hypothetical protein
VLQLAVPVDVWLFVVDEVGLPERVALDDDDSTKLDDDVGVNVVEPLFDSDAPRLQVAVCVDDRDAVVDPEGLEEAEAP